MKKIFTSLDLKMIALIFMVVDHVNTYFGVLLGLPGWVHWLGRFVAPVFLYLSMEGFKHTGNRKKYVSRLFIGAMFMYIVNLIRNILTKNYIHPYTKQFDVFGLITGNNIFWTLFLFAVLFTVLEKIKERAPRRFAWMTAAIFIMLLTLFAEGGLYLLPMALACFFFDNDAKKVSIFLLIWTGILLSKSLFSYFTALEGTETLYGYLTFSSEFMMVTAIPFILSYNGERGGKGKKWEKNLFYIFYPAHLILIYLLSGVLN